MFAGAIRARLGELRLDVSDAPQAALERLLTMEYDVIVAEAPSGEPEGGGLIAGIRERRPATPILVLARKADPGLALRALRDGAYDVVEATVEPDELVAALRRGLTLRERARRMEEERAALERHAATLERALAEGAQALREANRARDDFLALVSHELRTPLTPILTWSEILKREPDAPRAREAADVIERNVRVQIALVEDLLDLARVTQSKLTLEVQRHDLRAIVRSALDAVAGTARDKGIDATWTEPSLPALVDADAGRLGHVFWHVLMNAVKFTPGGGRITVALETEGDRALVQIRDTGVGIHPRFLPHVFEVFRQQEEGARRQYGGLGIGLAIARHLVELHYGTIEVRSAGVDRGTEVLVRLPVAAAQPQTPEREGAEGPAASRLDGLAILVVEDSLDTSEATRLLLEDLGARVTVAKNGLDALEALAGHEPDVILCDLRMPGLDGFEFIRRLRADPRQGQVPVVAVSGFASSADVKRTREAGFDAHVSKPFDYAALLGALRRATGRPRYRRAS